MIEREWVRDDIDEPTVEDLQSRCQLDEWTARLLVRRGVTEPDRVERFLNPKLADLPDPSLLAGLDRAATRIAKAIEDQESVALYGDYDVDGVTSTSLLATFLISMGLTPRTYIPQRLTEGYGLNEEAVDTLAAEGTKLLITLDCGITATREIERANAHGIDCIVVDHHRCPPDLPDAYATLNPQQEHCEYPDKGLAAVGVCFNLIVGLRRLLREQGYYASRGVEQPNLRRYLDLVALGTIADMVPLSGTNRILAWYGLEEIRRGRRAGMRALMEVSRLPPGRCSSSDVGFRLGPRINAAGRLSDASVGVQLLLSEDMATARPLAQRLDQANKQRQNVEGDVYYEAVQQVEAILASGGLPEAVVVHDEGWHPGVVGIVASKLVEKYDRPAIVIGEGGRGSCRTAGALHLYNALADVKHHLFKFGGHRAAAGLTIEASKIEAFRQEFLSRVARDPDRGGGGGLLVYDEEIPPERFDRRILDSVSRLEPFGNGNPQPLFTSRGVLVRSARVVGKDHLKLRLAEGGIRDVDAIAFKRGEMYEQVPPGCRVDVAYHLQLNEFSGVEYLEMRLRDLRPVGA